MNKVSVTFNVPNYNLFFLNIYRQLNSLLQECLLKVEATKYTSLKEKMLSTKFFNFLKHNCGHEQNV